MKAGPAAKRFKRCDRFVNLRNIYYDKIIIVLSVYNIDISRNFPFFKRKSLFFRHFGRI